MDNNNIEASSVVVSNDETSKIIKIGKNTSILDFYQEIINKFNISGDINMKFFYYEGYYYKKKYYVITEPDFVIANQKGIEYLYFCSDNTSDITDYIRYYSVIIFSPIKKLNLQYQNEERKKMQLNTIQKNNNANNNINDNNTKDLMDLRMNNPMIMNPIMMYNMKMINDIMMNNQMLINNMVMNPMNMNNMIMNIMIMNFMKMINMLNNNMMNSIMIYNLMGQLSKIHYYNPNMGLFLMNQINPNILAKCYQLLQNKTKNQNTDNNNNNINNNNNKNNINNNNINISDYETIDTETNPINKYIENAINISYAIKYDILKEQQKHPEKFINIESTLSNPGLLSDIQPSDNDYNYTLCLIAKILQNNGIIVGIYKDYNKKDRIDLSAIQFIFSGLINKKKYKLQFKVDDYNNDDLNVRKNFIKKWKEIIANRLNINKKLIILTNPRKRQGYLILDLAFNPKINCMSEEFVKQKLVHDEIVYCQMSPLLEACRLSPSIFDVRYHKYYSGIYNNNNINNSQRRGGEEYLSPIYWTAFGINVLGKYDFGNNKWLGNKNEPGEFAVAYYGINNISNNNLIQNIMSLMGNLESGKTFVNVNNSRNPGQKCKSGAYFYRNPNYAENSSETIKIGVFEYKIMFMCRVNPSKIRQPENFQDCWILNPTPDEVRPYKILIKKIPKSTLAIASQQVMQICTKPDPSYRKILETKDESFYDKKNNGIGYNHLNDYDYVLKLYSMGSGINNYLRNPENPSHNINDSKSYVWCLHKAITENSPNVKDGTILYRGICHKLPNDIGVGTEFYFPEFLSTSKDINIAERFAVNGTLMHITVQNNGTNGKKNYCRDIEYISNHPQEKEILFTSYCHFKVTNIERTPALDTIHLICEGHHF